MLHSDLIRRRRAVVLPANIGPRMTWISPGTKLVVRLSLSATPSIRELNETSDLSEDIDKDMVVRRQ